MNYETQCICTHGIHKLNLLLCIFRDEWPGFFNWTMTFRQDSDLPFNYGGFELTKPHPTEETELKKYIDDFGRKNTHLAKKKNGKKEPKIAWFVSNCRSHGEREKYVDALQKHLHVSKLYSIVKWSNKCGTGIIRQTVNFFRLMVFS